MSSELKKRFCSTGSHWTAQKFHKIGPNRWICASCNERRKSQLRNLRKSRKLARRRSP